tara:strand:+ start:61 stop:270 length:210 start_codon:yes stop_codon:yes gene_type:complete
VEQEQQYGAFAFGKKKALCGDRDPSEVAWHQCAKKGLLDLCGDRDPSEVATKALCGDRDPSGLQGMVSS